MTASKTLPDWLTRDIGSSDLKTLMSRAYGAFQHALWRHPKVVFRWEGDRLTPNDQSMALSNSWASSNADCLLEIPEARTLAFDLPPILAAEHPSAALILAQISNWTPFRADEVWLLPPNDRSDNPRECLYVPRHNLMPPLAVAACEGIRIDGIIFEMRPDASVLFEKRASWVRRIRHRALPLVIALLPLSLGLVSWAYLSRIERQESHLQQHLVQLLNEARQGNATGNERLDRFVRTKHDHQPSADLATLLTALPPDIALDEVSWQANRFQIRIDEKDGARLVEALGFTRWAAKPPIPSDAGRRLVEAIAR
jgi:hypothetical protein